MCREGEIISHSDVSRINECDSDADEKNIYDFALVNGTPCAFYFQIRKEEKEINRERNRRRMGELEGKREREEEGWILNRT